MKVLNYTGLQNLWTNIKNYITVHTPTKTSDLTNDTGFLTSTDISSKANDSEVLHKAQNETVTGEKTFKKDVKIIDLNANERPGVKFEVNGSFRTFEQAKDALPDTDFGDFGVGTVWSGWVLDDNTKIQNSMSDYVINDITFGTTNYSSVIEFNNYYKVKYEETDNVQTDLRGMLRFELLPYAGVQKDSMIWTNPKLYFYAMLDNDEFGDTILGHEDAHWSKAYIDEINCYEIKFGGNSIRDILENIVSLSYVTHYSSTSLTSNSTNSLSIIDNQDSVKVNDKVIDSAGKMFYITAVDLSNDEFTVGSVVDTFAKDSGVVHNLGNETVGGIKTFSDDTYIKSLNFTNEVPSQSSSSSSLMPIIATITYGDSSPSAQARLNFRITADGSKSLYPHENNQYSLGLASRKWSAVYGTAFYYGSNAVEFSDKFVTADTSQTITGAKSWANAQVWSVNCQRRMTNAIEKGDVPSTSVARNDYYTLKNGSTTYADALGVFGCTLIDNNAVSTYFHAIKNVAGITTRTVFSVKYYTNTDEKTVETNGDIIPTASSQNLGNSTSKWSTINGLNPSSLGLPDLDNGIDISSYITVTANANKESLYTPLDNGWICVRLSRTSGALGVLLIQGDLAVSGKNIEVESGATTADASLPVIGGVQVSINSALADGIVSAYFYPCLGNV